MAIKQVTHGRIIGMVAEKQPPKVEAEKPMTESHAQERPTKRK